ncbi:ATP-binding protein [Vibrio coralliilyticus]|uniref:ATP-binding protein n=1 Tax=Vibrio coralliilyticus TaxID=190893 RepID=UPI002409A102|nr:ATP-binding protein [Vibrio coralliilyticus]WFB47067.1 ATP-binding protein [Vibrio coralliilyticus]
MSQEKLADKCRERRLAVSIGSIKRAEAGKNILYRTVSSLACFFNVTVGELLDDVSPSLLEYTVQNYPEGFPCVGRTHELSQLRFVHHLAAERGQSACVYGMQGVGKTNLISHFLRSINVDKKCNLYISVTNESQLFEQLIRAVLHLPQELDSDVIRSNLKKVVKSPIVYFHMLRLMGLYLSRAETAALDGLSDNRRNEVDVLVLMVLIQRLKETGTSILVIDGLQSLGSRQAYVVQLLIEHTQNLPIFILLGVTCSLQFSTAPYQLPGTYLIPLTLLDHSNLVALADSISLSQPKKVASPSHKSIAISRSEGNPRILKALLTSQCSNETVPFELIEWVQRMMELLDTIETKLLYFLVAIGLTIELDEIDQYLMSCKVTGIRQLQKLVSVGFLHPLTDSYKFQHKIIWEALQIHVTKERQGEFNSLSQVS